ncbi:MAG: DUF1553 domain-containing protein [Planctomycetota bacterium]
MLLASALASLAFMTTPGPFTAFDRSVNAAELDFIRDIKPILSNNCYRCHGPDEAERKGGTAGLRLDTSEGAYADLGDGGRAIASGNPSESRLLARISTSDPNERMPPPGHGRALNAREIELLKTWIAQGAKYARHWSYSPPVRPTVPSVRDATWPKTDIDRFLLARLDREQLSPQPEADRHTLIRRLSLDLTGLPPTLAEVDAFVNDSDPEAYGKLVDRLLAKEAYGEYWAQWWLDLARYADSAGYADDPSRTIWLYRDYVIRSLNANKPFDRFTLEQIAGDLLPNPTDDQLVATAFHRNTLTNNEGGTNDEEFRNVAVVDRVNTTMAVWMGTTIACAQCHSHKYDPISQKDFFRFFAIFNSSADADRRDESPLLSVFTPDQTSQRAAGEKRIAELELALKTPTPAIAAGQAKWEAEFPRDIVWHAARPRQASTRSGAPATLEADGTVRIGGEPATERITVEMPAPPADVRALRLEALPDDSLPGKGPGQSGGNFVISSINATWSAGSPTGPAGKFVRIELPGKQKMLSLAEVQVFAANENVAPRGQAKQSSTDFSGDAKLAIDGNTDGRYEIAKSTTHTAASDDPWWEVELDSPRAVDRIVVWNRADPAVESRLANFRVSLLDANRQTVWTQEVAATPKPSVDLATNGQRSVPFHQAVADYSQPEFDAANVIGNKDPQQKGWAVGGQTCQPHAITLATASAVSIPADAKVTVTIEHAPKHARHVLGHFRLSWTADARAAAFGATPLPLVEALNRPAAQRTEAQLAALRDHYLAFAPELNDTRKQIADLRKQLADLQPATVPIMRELPANQRRITKIQHRGNFMDLGEQVEPGLPEAFHPIPTDKLSTAETNPTAAEAGKGSQSTVDRMTLARWLVAPENPLTARVVANRYWEQLFGVGIVATSEEFGSQGDLPFHPELLDWLATELVARQWDLKSFLKLLVTSAAYRQSSRVSPELAQLDPENRLLARGPRFRLAAETIRDQALAIAGLLSPKMYGPPVRPPQPSLGVSAAFGSGIDWQTSPGEDRFRRALYTTWRRSNPYPSMATFDAPNREVCTVRRVRTNTPLQALVTLNDPVYIEAAQALGRRALAEGGGSVESRLTYAFRLCVSRPPAAEELARLATLREQTLAKLAQQPDLARKLATDPIGPPPSGQADLAELAAWTVVGNVLLNLDETLMKR